MKPKKGEHCILGGNILYRCVAPDTYKIVDRADNFTGFDNDFTKSFEEATIVDPQKWYAKYKRGRYFKYES